MEMESDVRDAQAGDPYARDRLLEALWPRAFRLAVAILGDRAAAEDSAQDALVLVAARLGSLRDPASFRLWSGRIAVNAARDAARRRSRERRHEQHEVTASFDDAVTERLDVLGALAALPSWLRIPLVLRHVEGRSSREIGAMLDAPSATIRFRLALGRRRLAAALAEHDPHAREEFA
jgi:RNA polymerase sigma-70 factor (ECF subfamily)